MDYHHENFGNPLINRQFTDQYSLEQRIVSIPGVTHTVWNAKMALKTRHKKYFTGAKFALSVFNVKDVLNELDSRLPRRRLIDQKVVIILL